LTPAPATVIGRTGAASVDTPHHCDGVGGGGIGADAHDFPRLLHQQQVVLLHARRRVVGGVDRERSRRTARLRRKVRGQKEPAVVELPSPTSARPGRPPSGFSSRKSVR
jgi:hypothetical protein